MTRIFIDTSVFIRLLTSDLKEKYEQSKRLFELVESGKLIPYTSNIVLAEIIFVLTRIYKFPKRNILKDTKVVLQTRNLTLLEETDSLQALKLFRKYNAKYQDCLIATQVPRGVKLVTYDKDFSKMKALLSVATPGQLLNK